MYGGLLNPNSNIPKEKEKDYNLFNLANAFVDSKMQLKGDQKIIKYKTLPYDKYKDKLKANDKVIS
jgi:hypothetical protein